MTKTRMWALGVPVVVAVFVIGWFAFLTPQKSHASNLRDQAATQQQANAQLQGQIAVLDKQRAAVPSEQARIAQIAQKLPSNPALPSYVRFLTTAAAATHVDLVSVAPTAPSAVQVAAPTAASSAAPAATPASSGLSSVGITIAVNGDYFSIQQFLAQLEKSARATVVSTITLAPGQPLQAQNSGSAASSTTSAPTWQTLQATINATIFESAAPSAAPIAGAVAPAPAPAATSTTAPNN